MPDLSEGAVNPVELVVVGASLGGLNAVRRLLSALPDDFAPPLVIVQHRAARGTQGLRSLLAASTSLTVREASDHDSLQRGRVYLAPADYHVIVQRGALTLSTEARVTFARPSIDVLFESAAHAYSARVAGVVLTGASADGAAGASAIVKRGGALLVQDPREAESPIAPRATLERVSATLVGTIDELARWLVAHGGSNQGEGRWLDDGV